MHHFSFPDLCLSMTLCNVPAQSEYVTLSVHFNGYMNSDGPLILPE